VAASSKKKAKNEDGRRQVAVNKKALFKYNLVEKFECGIELAGTEVKSLRERNVSFIDSYCQMRNGNLYVVKLNISRYEPASWTNHDPVRPRRLLLHRREIDRLSAQVTQKGNTIVPIAIYFKNGWAKLEIALVTHKSAPDKRRQIKDREVKRDLDRARKMR
jgi:SsrA-binding protein